MKIGDVVTDMVQEGILIKDCTDCTDDPECESFGMLVVCNMKEQRIINMDKGDCEVLIPCPFEFTTSELISALVMLSGITEEALSDVFYAEYDEETE